MPNPRNLDRVRISGFRSIRDAEITLSQLNVLVGANGAGKSNLVELFDLLGALIGGRLEFFVRQRGGAAQMLHGGPSVTQRMTIRLDFGPNAYEVALAFGQNDELVFERETVYFHGEGHPRPYNDQLPGGGLESRLPEAARERGRTFAHVATSLHAYRVYHFHDTSPTAAVKQAWDIDDNAVLRPDAANLAAYLFRVQRTKPATYQRIVAAIRTVTPFLDDFDLRPDAVDDRRIRLAWRQRGSDQYFRANALSDGTLRFMSLATLLLSDEGPQLLVLDEPELGLHPYAIRQLASMLRSAASGRQVLLATQAIPLVDQFGLDDIIVVDRVDGASAFNRLEAGHLEAWLDDYSVGELWDKNLLGGRPRFETTP